MGGLAASKHIMTVIQCITPKGGNEHHLNERSPDNETFFSLKANNGQDTLLLYNGIVNKFTALLLEYEYKIGHFQCFYIV